MSLKVLTLLSYFTFKYQINNNIGMMVGKWWFVTQRHGAIKLQSCNIFHLKLTVRSHTTCISTAFSQHGSIM